MIRLHGVEGARLACDSHRSAIARIESICAHERIDCRLPARQRLPLPLARAGQQSYLDEELDAARQAGVEVEKLPTRAGRGIRQRPVPALSATGASSIR